MAIHASRRVSVDDTYSAKLNNKVILQLGLGKKYRIQFSLINAQNNYKNVKLGIKHNLAQEQQKSHALGTSYCE